MSNNIYRLSLFALSVFRVRRFRVRVVEPSRVSRARTPAKSEAGTESGSIQEQRIRARAASDTCTR